MMGRNGFYSLALLAGILIGSCGTANAAKVVANVDIHTGTMTVSVNGEQMYKWKVGPGRIDHETPLGKFHVVGLDANGYSKKYDAPMPWAVYFRGHAYAIHGHAGRRLGKSHGCIRLHPADAEKFFRLVSAQPNRHNTTIIIM